jgi:PAS domain S-box-containing protein
MPLITQAKLIGALYLENNLTPNVFAPARMAALKLLASQAAISLENSRLYGDLQEREAKIRRLVDANIIGIFIWDLDGRILEANDIFLRMVGYDRADLLSGRMRWTDLTPPEWHDQVKSIVEEVSTTGIARPYEKEYFRKDGSRVPVLIGSAIFEQAGNQGVAFLLDLTERKRAEAVALESERRFHEVQMELAHANRVATMGQLTASIAHEVNHPIAAMFGNAEAGLRWLNREPPQLDEVSQALARIVKDGRRASSVVGRLRELFKKTTQKVEPLDINGAIAEVIELTRGEVVKNGILTQIHLAEDLPVVQADRTQLQQVILNLIVNSVEALTDRGDSGRELSISTSTNGPGEILVSVCDSGPGITSENLERLFDPFYTTKPGGMGMGLSICRSIVEGHGGRIWAMANDPQGAAFHVTLPAAHQEFATEQNANHA